MEIPVSAKAALLLVLTKGPGFGLELADRVKDATNGAVVLRQGSIYPALRDFVEKKLVKVFTGKVSERSRELDCYELTKAGEAAAEEYRDTLLALLEYNGEPVELLRIRHPKAKVEQTGA